MMEFIPGADIGQQMLAMFMKIEAGMKSLEARMINLEARMIILEMRMINVGAGWIDRDKKRQAPAKEVDMKSKTEATPSAETSTE